MHVQTVRGLDIDTLAISTVKQWYIEQMNKMEPSSLRYGKILFCYR